MLGLGLELQSNRVRVRVRLSKVTIAYHVRVLFVNMIIFSVMQFCNYIRVRVMRKRLVCPVRLTEGQTETSNFAQST